jgi:hypothetical protein
MGHVARMGRIRNSLSFTKSEGSLPCSQGPAAVIPVLSQVQPLYVGVSKSFRTGRLERELQMVRLSGTRCSCIAIL